MPIHMLLVSILAGTFATFLMDVWSVAAGKTGLVSKPSSALLGRWVSLFSKGTFRHEDIRTAPPCQHEQGIGIVTHYAIGGTLGVVYVLLAGLVLLSPKNFVLGAIYGLLTSVFAWFVMFPSFGFGVCGTRGPANAKLLRTSTINHVVFGLGIATFFTVFVR